MSPRKNRAKAKPQQPKIKALVHVEHERVELMPDPRKPTHRPIAEIKRDIAGSPAQALPALQAELIAALDAERKG